MNTSSIKSFATKARRELLRLVMDKLAVFGINEDQCPKAELVGDAVIVNGIPYPKEMQLSFDNLHKAWKDLGYEQLVRSVSYTWFNRFSALRFMEVHDYLPFRVFSSTDGNTPDILTHAVDAAEELNMNVAQVREMKLKGTEDQELYRMLLLAQCRELAKPLGFLFDDDRNHYDTLLLPEGLLNTDSIIHDLVTEIPEEEWANIEIIGWLYQFYISEKKDEVIGKVVKSEDIPAATQLFTPNWIVKYMVQNSLGAQWLATYPQSPLKGQMEYYIEPAEQAPEVLQQLKEITPSSLDPEALTLIDPASGSGHILVEAYELFKAIYLDRGYRQRDIPQLILEKNLFGLDIDERAAQLTGFALMMKGRADDRRLFDHGVKPNVMALVDSIGFDAELLAQGVNLADYGLQPGDLLELKRLFEHATTFGSLIQVPEGLVKKLPALKQLSKATSQDLFISDTFKRLGLLIRQAELLGAQYDAVVANPPYMGGKYMGRTLKRLVKRYYNPARGDLFACFLLRQGHFVAPTGRASLVTMDSWMFLSGFRDLRSELLHDYSINSLVHVGWNCFPEGHTYNRGVALTLNRAPVDIVGRHLNLSNVPATVSKGPLFLQRRSTGAHHYDVSRSDFLRVPDAPIAYWISPALRASFENTSLGDVAELRAGITTGDNDRFVRYWSEVSWGATQTSAYSREDLWKNPNHRWVPLKSGGDFRKWYGNFDKVIRFDRTAYNELREMGNQCASEDCYFKAGITWSDISSTKDFGARYCGPGAVFTTVGHSLFAAPSEVPAIGGLLCSRLSTHFLALINPTLHANPGDVARVPFFLTDDSRRQVGRIYETCVKASILDWNQSERSWDFQALPILADYSDPNPTLESSYTAWITHNRETIAEMKHLEEENNRLFIDAYGLQDELTPDVTIDQITLSINPAYRYGGKLPEEEQWARFSEDTMKELLSYSIGCMMGRYSLDRPGLILASQGESLDDYYKNVSDENMRFAPDDDGIIPILEDTYFVDDCYHRLVEFLSAAFSPNTLDENLQFLASHFKPKKNETTETTLRRYLSTQFFKDHISTKYYKKRPIYWLVSSGKERAFQCLVYMHRYTPATLSRMRTTYVRELQNKLHAERDHVEQTSNESGISVAEKSTLSKRLTKLDKQVVELRAFDEKLRHLADKQIAIDLDDGVKHNYGLFGDLLSEVKAITGKPPVKV